jgi:hypothetical protein
MKRSAIPRRPHAFKGWRASLLAGGVFALVLALGSSALKAGSGSGLGDIIELRGYAKVGDVYEFSIYNKQSERGEWLRENESRDGYTIEEFDSEKNTVTIRYHDRVGTISLQRSRIVQYDPPATSPRPTYEPAAPPPGRPSESQSPPPGSGFSRPETDGESATGGQDGTAAGEAPAFYSGGSITAPSPPSGSGPDMPPAVPPGSDPPPDASEPGDDDEYDGGAEDDETPPPDPDSPPPGYTPDQ